MWISGWQSESGTASIPFYNSIQSAKCSPDARHHTLVQRPRKFLSGRWQAALAVRVLEQEVAGYYYQLARSSAVQRHIIALEAELEPGL